MSKSRTNLAWDTLLDLGERGGGPLHERLTRAIREAIRAGTLPQGSALPPSRRLAADLGCSRWVVIQAYEQLLAEGYLAARVGSATRVRWPEGQAPPAAPAVPAPRRRPRLDLGPGLPDLRAFPRRAWLAALRAELDTVPHSELAYPGPGGHPRLRQVLAEYLGRVRGAAVRAEDVTVVTGVTDGMTQVFRALVAAGASEVAVEDPGWYRLHRAVRSAGLALVPVPVDEHGMRVEELPAIPGAGGPDPGAADPGAEAPGGTAPGLQAVIVTPAHHFPTGTVLAPARRAALVEWARRAGALVLEDDYDAEFRYDRRPVGTVQGTDPARVALFGSLSKTLAPAASIGWVVTPPRWTRVLRAAESRLTGPPVLDQLALARFIQSGAYDRHLRSVRQRYRRRRDRLVHALGRLLPDCPVSGVAAGLHVVLHLPAGVTGGAAAAGAAERGVRVMDLRTCRVPGGAQGPEGLVLGYGNLDDAAVEPAVRELAEALRQLTPLTSRRPGGRG